MVRTPGCIFISNHLTTILGTPKHQHGWKAQQARAVVAAAATATAAAAIPTTAITTTTATAPTTTPTPTAAASPVDDDNPFLVAPSYGQLVEPNGHMEGPSRISPLEDQLQTLSIRSPADRHGVNHNLSDISPMHQKSRKDAQDVRAFFRQATEQWHCKFCEYVYHLSNKAYFSNI